jgi:hypothetical protein
MITIATVATTDTTATAIADTMTGGAAVMAEDIATAIGHKT